MSSPQVAIVGGGPGGLMTAYLLQKWSRRPPRVTLFEADNRLGGKLRTPRFETAAVFHEAGAAEFYDYSHLGEDPLKELVAELGLSTVPLGGSAVMLGHQTLANLDDLRRHHGAGAVAALRRFDRWARDWMSPREYYHAEHLAPSEWFQSGRAFESLLADVADPPAARFVRTLTRSDLATEPARTDIAYGLQNYLMNDPRYMRLYGVEGGNEQVATELARRLAADVRLGCAALSVGRAETGYAVTHRQGQATRREVFDAVVLALPHQQLAALTWEGASLETALRRHLAHYNYPAHYLRVTLLFDRSFWRHAWRDAFMMLDRFDGCCLYDESLRQPGARHGVLGWLLGGAAAVEWSALSDAELADAAFDALPDDLFEAKTGPERPRPLESRVWRWIGGVNGMPGGAAPRGLDERHRPEPREHSRLFVVGDYLYDSTLNGVLDSAEYVAAWLANELAAG